MDEPEQENKQDDDYLRMAKPIVLRHIQADGISINNLFRLTGFPKPNLRDILSALLEDGSIVAVNSVDARNHPYWRYFPAQ